MKFLIYGLIDPCTREMRYVGKSTSGLKRPRSHFRPASRQTHLSAMIKKHGAEIVVIEILNDPSNLNEVEIGWISYFKFIGCSLVNQTNGGEGVTGFSHKSETIEKISASNRGRRHSLESRAKIGSARLGKKAPHSLDVRGNISRAMKASWKKRKNMP